MKEDSSPEALEALAARCEREEPSRGLDAAIKAAVIGGGGAPKPYGSSLDSAVTLVRDIDCGVHWDVEGVHGGVCLYVWTDHPTAEHTFRRSPVCSTRAEAWSWLPRLICAAGLRALAALARNAKPLDTRGKANT